MPSAPIPPKPPVGWQVVDRFGDGVGEVAAFGMGAEEYERAKAEARRLNKGPLFD